MKFVIVSTPRTGTNLVIEMLNSHPDCFSGYEIFSDTHVAKRHVPWYLPDCQDEPQLCDLRLSDPLAFLRRLEEQTFAKGYQAVGFKLMYWEGERFPVVRDHVAADEEIHIIHVKRRNLLRRYLSYRMAERTGQWWAATGEEVLRTDIRLTLAEILADIAMVRSQQREYEQLLVGHPTLELYYEDLEQDLMGTARSLWRFLDLRPWETLNITSRKTGARSLEATLENYGELKDEVSELLTFLDH